MRRALAVGRVAIRGGVLGHGSNVTTGGRLRVRRGNVGAGEEDGFVQNQDDGSGSFFRGD